jgi:FkbM family methyltransferase
MKVHQENRLTWNANLFGIPKRFLTALSPENLSIRIAMRRRKHLEQSWRRRITRGQTSKVRVTGGAVMRVYPDDKISEYIFKKEYESHEQEFVFRFLRSSDKFVDVGANIGLFTLIAGKKVGRKGRVYSFEPSSKSYERLLKNIALNRLSNVECFRLAISNKSERLDLISSIDGFAAWNSLARPTAGSKFVLEEVDCVTWDSFAVENNLVGTVALMKIDIEGWELFALDGAASLLSRTDAPSLLIEFTDINASAAGTSCHALYRRLEELGFQLYSINARRRVLHREQMRDRYPYVNMLATKHVDDVCHRSGFTVIEIG